MKTKNNLKEIPLNKIIKPVIFIIFAFILEIIQFNAISDSQILPTYFFFDLGVWIVMAGLIFVWNKIWLQNIFFYLFLAIQLVLNIVNAMLYNIFGYVFYFNMLTLLNEGIGAFSFSLIDWVSVAINLIILAGIITIQIIVDKKLSKFKVQVKKLPVLAFNVMILLSCCLAGTTTYAVQKQCISKVDNEFFWTDLTFKNASLQKFGLYGYYLKDIYNLINYPSLSVPKDELLSSIKSGETKVNTDATLFNDNLIMIMLESFDWFAIDPYNTPNLYKLLNESVLCTNYVSNNKTNVSEDIGLIGYMPFEETLNIQNADTLTTKYSLPNLFKQQGYDTRYFHSYVSEFYNRININKYIGFDELYFLDNAEIDKSPTMEFDDWSLEVDFFEYYKEKIAPTDGSSFMSYYLTVSTHGTYDKPDNKRFAEYYETYDKNLEDTDFISWFEAQGYKYPKDAHTQKLLRNFKCAAMDTDKMIGKLFEHLNKELEDGSKLIDNTTVLFYADHNCYFEDLCYNIKGTNKSDYTEVDSYIVPMMIYSKNLEARKIDTFTNTYDLYPTICELYGLPYNKFMTLGYNILSEEDIYRVYFSQLVGYYTDRFYASDVLTVTPLDGNATEQEIDECKDELVKFYKRHQALNHIYKQKYPKSII